MGLRLRFLDAFKFHFKARFSQHSIIPIPISSNRKHDSSFRFIVIDFWHRLTVVTAPIWRQMAEDMDEKWRASHWDLATSAHDDESTIAIAIPIDVSIPHKAHIFCQLFPRPSPIKKGALMPSHSLCRAFDLFSSLSPPLSLWRCLFSVRLCMSTNKRTAACIRPRPRDEGRTAFLYRR